MGAPKQKWTPEEEAALRAGIRKYGPGKWSTILKDPQFNAVLISRSNVDLKDKWRNLNCMANGLGSRRPGGGGGANKNKHLALKQEESATIRGSMVEKDSVVIDPIPVSASNDASQDASSKKQIPRLDDIILEAITKLKEPRGSSRQTIAQYIREHSAPPDFERTLAASLKLLTENGRLMKVKSQYRIAPRSTPLIIGKEPSLLQMNGSINDPSESQSNSIPIITQAQVDDYLERMKSMSAAEARAAAARAVAEAEAAISAAEAAAREAEDAEAEAEASNCFHATQNCNIYPWLNPTAAVL